MRLGHIIPPVISASQEQQGMSQMCAFGVTKADYLQGCPSRSAASSVREVTDYRGTA